MYSLTMYGHSDLLMNYLDRYRVKDKRMKLQEPFSSTCFISYFLTLYSPILEKSTHSNVHQNKMKKISEHVGRAVCGHATLPTPTKYLVHTVKRILYSSWKLATFLLMHYILITKL